MGQSRLTRAILAAACGVLSACGPAPENPADVPVPDSAADSGDWIELFNGRDLTGWTAKIRGYEPGVNFADTFRVEDGLLTVSYDGYDTFDNRFGHLFYETPFSHYRLKLEYRFIDEQAPGGEDWAHKNSGAMLHSPPPESMPAAQDFPISLEAQFLGGLVEGEPRPTANLCTPGTNVHIDGVFTEEHCIPSSSPTFYDDQWVQIELLVLGSERFVHYVNGEAVIEYTDATYGGGVVSGYDPAYKPDGEPVERGYISLQSESHPIQFRNVRLLNLRGCMTPGDPNYRDYFVAPDASCAGN